MISKVEGSYVIAKLEKDENLFETLFKIMEKHRIESGMVVFAIGALRGFELGYFDHGQYIKRTYSEIHELLSLHGSIASVEPRIHIHASLGNREHQVVGGHLFSGIVDPLMELLILKLEHTKLTRKENEKTGLKELYF